MKNWIIEHPNQQISSNAETDLTKKDPHQFSLSGIFRSEQFDFNVIH